jgi:RimJ/RimL family protein N-acetyltransferase
MEQVAYRLLVEEDFLQLGELMEKIKPEIAGLSATSLYSAICRDALSNESVVIVAAHDHQRLIGFNITVIDRKRYWRAFLLRHPVIGFRIAHHRFIRALSAKIRVQNPAQEIPEAIHEYISPSSSTRSWQDSAPWIASIFITAVDSHYRGKGISEGIGKYLLKVLADRGVRCVVSIIDPDNIPSIRLSHSLGFKIEKSNSKLFISIDLD